MRRTGIPPKTPRGNKVNSPRMARLQGSSTKRLETTTEVELSLDSSNTTKSLRRLALSQRAKTPMGIASPCTPKLSPRMDFVADLRNKGRKSAFMSPRLSNQSSENTMSNTRRLVRPSLSPRKTPNGSPRAVVKGTATYLGSEYKNAIKNLYLEEDNRPPASMLHLNYALLLENTATSYDQLKLADAYYEKAIDIGIDANDSKTNDVVANVALNRAHMLHSRLSDDVKAEKWYRLALAREPKNVACCFGLAQFLYAKALKAFQERTRQLEERKTPIRLIEADFSSPGGLLEATTLFKRAIGGFNMDPEVLFVAACYFREIGNTKEARKYFEMTNEYADNDSIIKGGGFSTDAAFRQQVYGYFLIEHCLPKDIEDEAGTSDDLRDHAIKVLKGARSMDSKNALLIGKHGKALEMLNEDPEKVLKCYKYALKKLPNNIEILWNLAKLLEKKFDKIDEAALYYEKAMMVCSKSPPNWRLFQYGKFVWKKKKDQDTAMKLFQRVYQTDPANAQLLDAFDELIYEVHGERETVVDMYYKAIHIRENDYNLVLKCIEFMEKCKKWRKADFAYGRAIKMADEAKEKLPRRHQHIHYEYGKFLIKIRNQFSRSNKHFVVAQNHDGISDMYESMIGDRVALLEKQNEATQKKHKETKAKGKPKLLDISKDKVILMYRVGFMQFLDVVLHEYDKAKEQADTIIDADSECITAYFIKARIEIIQNSNFKKALEYIHCAIDAGYVESSKQSNNWLETDDALLKLKESDESKETYIEALSAAKVPMNLREAASKGKKSGKKKKK